jgi:hypothetical protein
LDGRPNDRGRWPANAWAPSRRWWTISASSAPASQPARPRCSRSYSR